MKVKLIQAADSQIERKSLEPENLGSSLFGKVLKRRKSRQSNFGPGCIDFDYAGDSA